jgi:hypothetical protein
MAALFQHRLPVLIRALLLLAIAPAVAAASSAEPGGQGFLDAVLAELGGGTVTASDIGLARALRLFGFHPSDGPIQMADIQRLVDVRLVEVEAVHLGIAEADPGNDTAWEEATARLGGPSALRAWLLAAGIDPTWARRLVGEDYRWRRFIDLRFRAFVFVSEEEVTQALGPGPHTAEARQRRRESLLTAAVDRSLAEWLAQARAGASIRLIPTGLLAIPNPIRMPPETQALPAPAGPP